jgi:hypothetical protein
MRHFRLSRPPRSLRQSTVHLDNVGLVPASFLSNKAQWQAIANDRGRGEIIVVIPYQLRQQRVARSVVAQLRAKGRPVRVMA